MNPVRSERWGPWLAGFALALAFVILMLAGIYTLRQQRHVDRALCKSTVENRRADRVQWLTYELQLAPTIKSPAARERFHVLIQDVLRPIPALECVDNKPVPKEGK